MSYQLFMTASHRAVDIYRTAFKAGRLGHAHGDVVRESYRLATVVYRRRAGRAAVEAVIGALILPAYVLILHWAGVDMYESWLAHLGYSTIIAVTSWRVGVCGAYREATRLLSCPRIKNESDES